MIDLVKKSVAGLIIAISFIAFGVLLAPFWLLVVIFGVSISAIDIKNAPKTFFDLASVKWLFSE